MTLKETSLFFFLLSKFWVIFLNMCADFPSDSSFIGFFNKHLIYIFRTHLEEIDIVSWTRARALPFTFPVPFFHSEAAFLHLIFFYPKINGKEIIKHELSVTVTIFMNVSFHFLRDNIFLSWLYLLLIDTILEKEIEADAL